MKKFNFEKFGFIRNIFFICFFALFLCLLLFATTFDVHAESNQTSDLPYVVSSMSHYNEGMLSHVDEALAFYYRTFNVPVDTPVVVWTSDGYFNGLYYQYNFLREPYLNPNYAYGTVYDLSTNQIHLSSDYQICRVLVDESGNLGGSSWNLGLNANFCGYNPTNNSGTSPHGSWCPNFPFYYNGDPLIYEPLSIEVFVADVYVPTPLPTGHAQEPNFDDNSFINDSNNNPIARPNRPTPNPYSPTTWNPPGIDTSNLESLLESIWECLEYGFDYLKTNLGGWFNNLLSNLDSWFGYLTDSLYYLGNKIISAISNLADFLFDNFSSLFEPLFDFIKPIVTFFSSLIGLGTVDGEFSFINLTSALFLPDVSDLQDIIEESDTLDLINISNTIVLSVRSIWTGLIGINPVKIIHVPYLVFHGVQIGNFDIDFSWYDSYKPLGDGIISAFLIFNYIWFLFFRLPSFLRGSSSDFNHDVGAAADSSHETFKGKVGF